jgi:hypothetical protein
MPYSLPVGKIVSVQCSPAAVAVAVLGEPLTANVQTNTNAPAASVETHLIENPSNVTWGRWARWARWYYGVRFDDLRKGALVA